MDAVTYHKYHSAYSFVASMSKVPYKYLNANRTLPKTAAAYITISARVIDSLLKIITALYFETARSEEWHTRFLELVYKVVEEDFPDRRLW